MPSETRVSSAQSCGWSESKKPLSPQGEGASKYKKAGNFRFRLIFVLANVLLLRGLVDFSYSGLLLRLVNLGNSASGCAGWTGAFQSFAAAVPGLFPVSGWQALPSGSEGLPHAIPELQLCLC